MDRGAIISEAWSIMKSNRSLWGIAGLVFIVQVINVLLFGWIDSLIPSIIETLVDLLLAALLSGALISMVNAISEKQPVSFSTGMDAGFRWLSRLFIINLILAMPIWVIGYFYTRSLNAALTAEASWSLTQIQQWTGAFGVSVVFILLASILCNAIGVGAERAIVLRQHLVMKALKHGWQLFWTHLGDYIGIALRLLVISIGIGLLFACGLLSTGFVFGSSGSISIIVRTIISLIVSIVITVLESATWTLAFREWQAQERSNLPAAPKFSTSTEH